MTHLKLRMTIFKDALICQVLEQEGSIEQSSTILNHPNFTISEDHRTLFLPIKRDKTFDTDPLITVSSNPVYLRKEIAKGIEKILFVPTDDLIGKKVNLIGRDSSMYYRVLGKTTSGLFILEDSYENLIKAHEEDILGTITKSQSGDVFTWTRN